MTTSKQLSAMLVAGTTQRFHTCAGYTLKTQDVAQHVYGIFWIAYALTKGARSPGLMMAIMQHDAGEVWAGDMPGPTKRALDIQKKLGSYEDMQYTLYTAVEVEELPPFEAAVLKLADALEGAYFCLREGALGNHAIDQVWRNFIDYARKAAGDSALDDPRFDRALCTEIIDGMEAAHGA